MKDRLCALGMGQFGKEMWARRRGLLMEKRGKSARLRHSGQRDISGQGPRVMGPDSGRHEGSDVWA